MMAAMTARPPTTPPTIAPIGVELPEELDEAELLAAATEAEEADEADDEELAAALLVTELNWNALADEAVELARSSTFHVLPSVSPKKVVDMISGVVAVTESQSKKVIERPAI